MPCHDNMPPSSPLQDRVSKAASLFVAVLKHFGEPIPKFVYNADRSGYSTDLNVEPALCTYLTKLSERPAAFESVMSSKDYWLKDLRKWWAEHQVIDAIREGRETPDPVVYKRLYETALKKLLRHEAIILGCVDKWDAVHNFTPSTEIQSEEDNNASR